MHFISYVIFQGNSSQFFFVPQCQFATRKQCLFNFVNWNASDCLGDGCDRPPLAQLQESVNPIPLVSTAKPTDGWRTTRNQSTLSTVDSHDDFLDSPRKKALSQSQRAPLKVPRSPWRVIRFAPANVAASSKPSHKKVDHEMLIGIPCNLYACFYNAIDENIRLGSCDHIDRASRHRYARPPHLAHPGSRILASLMKCRAHEMPNYSRALVPSLQLRRQGVACDTCTFFP